MSDMKTGRGEHGWSDRGIQLSINGRSFDMLCTRDQFQTEEDPSVAALMWAASTMFF